MYPDLPVDLLNSNDPFVMNVFVPPENMDEFERVAEEIIKENELEKVTFEAIPDKFTRENLCAIFIDSRESPAVAHLFNANAMFETTNRIFLGTPYDPEDVAPLVLARYGDVAAVEKFGVTFLSRNGTNPPTGAGTGLWRADLGARTCTQGFTLRNNSSGALYGTTAGHCGPVGSGASSQFFVSGGGVGHISGNMASSDMDVAFLSGGNYNGKVWRGSVNT